MDNRTIQIAVKATPDRVWEALTNGKITPAYYYGFEAEFDLTAGAPYRYTAGGAEMITGRVLSVEPGRSLTTTFNGRWNPDVAELAESTVTFSIAEPPMPTPGVTVLSLVHEGLPEGPVAADVHVGWVLILSGLKTLLETDEPMIGTPNP